MMKSFPAPAILVNETLISLVVDPMTFCAP
jgi:hypothetical protein